jgi:hypothetical protein
VRRKIERIKTSLQIDEDIDLHILGWRLQRIGWSIMLVFLLCASLGLFGSGVLSEKSVTRDGASVKYERFTRYQSDTEVEIRAKSRGGSIVVELPDDFTRNFKIEDMIPEPRQQKIVNGSSIYTFSAEGDGEVTFFVSARERGNVKTAVLVNGVDYSFQTYIYP